MKVSAARKAQFCDALVRGQSPEGAARVIGVDRATAFRWKAADPAFAAAWEDARDRKVEFVETALYRKAVEGEAWAICFFLKCHKPAVYNRRTQIALGGDPNAPPIGITGEVVHFYMPPNGRDLPELEDEADASDPPIEIEGEAEDAA